MINKKRFLLVKRLVAVFCACIGTLLVSGVVTLESTSAIILLFLFLMFVAAVLIAGGENNRN